MSILFNPDLLLELVGEVLSHCTRFELSQLALINKQWYERIAPRLTRALHLDVTYKLKGPGMYWCGKESDGKTSFWTTMVWLTIKNRTLIDMPLLENSFTGQPFGPEEEMASFVCDSWHIATPLEIKALEPSYYPYTNAPQKALLTKVVTGHFHGVVLIGRGNICCIDDYPALCDELHRVAEIARRLNVPFNFKLTPFCPLPRPADHSIL